MVDISVLSKYENRLYCLPTAQEFPCVRKRNLLDEKEIIQVTHSEDCLKRLSNNLLIFCYLQNSETLHLFVAN
jgi:hypothetical protein